MHFRKKEDQETSSFSVHYIPVQEPCKSL